MALNDHDKPWTDEVSVASGQTSSPILIPGWVTDLVATALPGGGGSALVQHTNDEPNAVEANPGGADWVDWDEGSVTAGTTQAAMGRLTALRISATAQAATLKVSGTKVRQ